MKAIKSMPIRKAIREVLRVAHIAKETHNRQLQLECNDWLRKNIRNRNSGKLWFFRPA